MNGIWTSLIGLFGVVAGVVLNEVLRRSRRVETFTPKIFEKRLAKYEELMALLQAGYEVASDVMENPEHSVEERHDLISGAALSIARFTDQEDLYIDDELAAHCVAAFLDAEDVMSIEDPAERETARRHIGDMYVEAKRMIREDSGVHQIDKLFKTIHKPKLSGPIIDRIRYLKSHPEEVGD